jgi:hypothetical protein
VFDLNIFFCICVQGLISFPKGCFHKNITLVEKIKKLYVLTRLVHSHSRIANFDLWMLKGTYDVFALVINLLGIDW